MDGRRPSPHFLDIGAACSVLLLQLVLALLVMLVHRSVDDNDQHSAAVADYFPYGATIFSLIFNFPNKKGISNFLVIDYEVN